MDLTEKLNIANQTEEIVQNANMAPKTPRKRQQPLTSSNVDMLDEAVYGPSTPTTGYSADAEMKRIQERQKKPLKEQIMSNRKMPRAIIESIIQEPLDMPANADPKMTQFTDKLSSKLSGGNMSASLRIQEKLEQRDGKKAVLNEVNKNTNTASGVIDYSLIKQIVENAVDERLGRISEVLNENVNRSGNSLTCMKMSDKFLFLDNDNNVFECKMVYKGKNKRKVNRK